jgi:DNA-binding response OmpR family regulator
MSEPSQILLVDPDTFLQEMIESGLLLFNPGFRVLKADSPEVALRLLRRHKVEALITELEFAGSPRAGRDFLSELAVLAPQMPLLVLTELPLTEARRQAPSAVCLSKPPDLDALLRRVHQLVQESRESILRGISLESFLQVLEVERKTCTLTVTSQHRVGRLYIHDGKLIHAETRDHASKAAAFAMLSWPDYSIKIIERCDATPTITERLNAILMEWCVNKDHGLLIQ